METKICNVCLQRKSIDEFSSLNYYSKSKGRRTPRPNCKACVASNNRANYKSGKTKAYHTWHTHNTRVKKLGLESTVTVEDVKSILNGDSCYYCKYPNDGSMSMHIDHKQPLSKGGSHSMDNLALTCQCCNLSKRDLTEQEFRSWLENLATRLSN